MKKKLIGIIIISSLFILSGCSNNPNNITSETNNTKNDVHIKDTNNDVNANNIIANKTSNINEEVSSYYGKWKISKPIGHTSINTKDTSPINKVIVISKDSYSNNSFKITIKNPTYNISKISSENFCKSFQAASLNETGLKNNTITALDVSSTNKNDPQFDELYIQDGYIVYLQGGILFKCTKEKSF